MSMNSGSVFALSHAISSGNVGGLNTTYITLDVNAQKLEATAFTAGNTLTQAQGLSQMAQALLWELQSTESLLLITLTSTLLQR